MIAGCGAGPAALWRLSNQPKLRVSVEAGCRKSITGYQDVVNTFSGSSFVPVNPDAGIVCWYKAAPNGSLSPLTLARQTRLGSTQAQTLAEAARALNLHKPGDFATSCQSYTGPAWVVAVIGFSYPQRSDVGLWYSTSSCPTVDNGRYGAYYNGNPSFYNGFAPVLYRLSGWICPDPVSCRQPTTTSTPRAKMGPESRNLA